MERVKKMRKRIPLLLFLLLSLTALAPFVQTAAETEGALQETAAGDIVAVTPTGTAVPLQDDNTDPGEEPAAGDVSDLNDTNGNVCIQGQSGCEMPGTASEEEIHENSADPDDAGDNDPTDLSDMNTDEDQAAQASRLVSASPVTWHMNFSVDCVSTNCISLSDRIVGMYVSACNDGGGEYRSIEFTPVNQVGEFVSYSVTEGDYPDLGNTNTIQISNPSSSFSYGPLPPHKCVTAMFESEITSPPADYTEYKRFEYRLTADNGESVQTTTAYADKYGCYVPGSSTLSVAVSEFEGCIEPDSPVAEYMLRIDNTGRSDLCGVEVSADRPGTFHLPEIVKSRVAGQSTFLYDWPIYSEDYLILYFDEMLQESSPYAGELHTVNFTVDASPCIYEKSSAHATAVGRIRICSEPEGDPDISLDITAPTECSLPDPDRLDLFPVTVTNTGDRDFCSVEITGSVGSRLIEINGEAAEDGNTIMISGLRKGGSIDMVFAYGPVRPVEDSYTVSFTARGSIFDGNFCREAVSAEASAEVQVCPPEPEPALEMEIGMPSDCVDPASGTPNELTVTLTNSGETEFCRAVVSGPIGSVLHLAGHEGNGNSIVIDSLLPGQSVIIRVQYDTRPHDGVISLNFTAEGFISDSSECGDKPAATATAEAEIPLCPAIPEIGADIDAEDECHVYSGDSTSDAFSYTVTNPGKADYCIVSARFDVIVNGKIVHTDVIEIDPASIPAGGSLTGTFEVHPEEIPEILPGGSYNVRITASAGSYGTDMICPAQPSVSAEAETEKQVCPDVKPVLSVINMNPECIDAGDILKFKGLIDIDPHSAAKRITVNTGKISWGGTSYSCNITSVKKSADTEFAAVTDDEKGSSYVFEDFGHGSGAVGFICEAETSDNEQMRNGRGLSFSASAEVSSAGYVEDYEISSNTVEAAQKCSYTHTTLLPNTGDDTNMPVLIGLFSLFLICGGASSFMLIRKKKPAQVKKDHEE